LNGEKHQCKVTFVKHLVSYQQFSRKEKRDIEEIRKRIYAYVKRRGWTEDGFGFYIDMSFREFWLRTESN